MLQKKKQKIVLKGLRLEEFAILGPFCAKIIT